MTKSPEAVALAYLDSVAKKELDRCAAMLHPDILFTGPARTFTGAAEVLAGFRRIGVVHARTDIKRVFSDGDEVCVIYDFVTDTLGTLPAVEWLRIEDGRVRSVNLYYDQVPWAKLSQEMTRRAAQASA